MPTYQYQCAHCGHEFEILQSMNENRLKKCPECHQLKLQRLIGTGSGVIFKGTGFYETDYKKKTPSAKDSKSEAPKPQKPSGGGGSHGCSSHCGCAN